MVLVSPTFNRPEIWVCFGWPVCEKADGDSFSGTIRYSRGAAVTGPNRLRHRKAVGARAGLLARDWRMEVTG
jgi:hypothetical protein